MNREKAMRGHSEKVAHLQAKERGLKRNQPPER